MRFEIFANRLPAVAPRAPVLGLLGCGAIAMDELAACSQKWKHILIVPGPDDNIDGLRYYCARFPPGANVHILYDNSVMLGNTTFIGTTMWPAETNRYWADENVGSVYRELRCAGKGISVVLSYFEPTDEVLSGFLFRPRAWFYGDRVDAPISGCVRGTFLAGGSGFEAPFEYQ